ncbi:TMEM43 family protein [Calothrix sp. PCC 7507]|uniref:TMEM43 family protein n=1 Tax=Calothrix sp. PCC 7507 TaxID=99598 RepID=UPI00029F050C|nr:TMEM43 family protein [Calothrix sp. PCC 7507]AFY34652.1 protein of unknown function DUF1625 [Calothrix sp. PCC 7507]
MWIGETQDNLLLTVRNSYIINSINHAVPSHSLVSLTDIVTTDGHKIGDNLYLIPGNYLQVNRIVEKYTQGNSEDEQEPYWIEIVSANATESTIFSVTVKNIYTKIGALQIDANKIVFPDSKPINLNSETILPQTLNKVAGDYLFFGKGTIESPMVGDLRIYYKVVPSNVQATILGGLEGQKILPFASGSNQLYRLYFSTHGEALKQLESELSSKKWDWRLQGGLSMWIGFIFFIFLTRPVYDWTSLPAGIGNNPLILAVIFVLVTMTLSMIGMNFLV